MENSEDLKYTYTTISPTWSNNSITTDKEGTLLEDDGRFQSQIKQDNSELHHG